MVSKNLLQNAILYCYTESLISSRDQVTSKGKCGWRKGRLQLNVFLCLCYVNVYNKLATTMLFFSYFNWKIVFSDIFCDWSTEQGYRSTTVPGRKLKDEFGKVSYI